MDFPKLVAEDMCEEKGMVGIHGDNHKVGGSPEVDVDDLIAIWSRTPI
jgi:hypothetical protein